MPQGVTGCPFGQSCLLHCLLECRLHDGLIHVIPPLLSGLFVFPPMLLRKYPLPPPFARSFGILPVQRIWQRNPTAVLDPATSALLPRRHVAVSSSAMCSDTTSPNCNSQQSVRRRFKYTTTHVKNQYQLNRGNTMVQQCRNAQRMQERHRARTLRQTCSAGANRTGRNAANNDRLVSALLLE